MSENPMNETPGPSPELPLDAGVARRRLLRAGLSAAPVLLALKSQSVLAADICIKPSAFSSLKAANMKLSRAPKQGWICYSHGYWKNQSHPAPYATKAKSYFLAVPNGSTGVSAGFSADPGGFAGLTLQNVLDLNGNGTSSEAFARHVVATFLTAVLWSDDATKVLLTTWQCKQLWDNQGNWSPVAGATWTKSDWMDYFDYVYG